MEFYNYNCQAFGKRLKLFECSYLKVNNEHYLFNQMVKYDRDMGTEYKVRVWIDARPMFAKKSFRFADVKFDMCSIFEHKFDLQLLRLFMAEFKKSNNLPQHCPLKGVSMTRWILIIKFFYSIFFVKFVLECCL